MTIFRSTMTRKSSRTVGFVRRYLVAGMFVCLAAISAVAQTENIVVTLLPLYVDTTDIDTQGKGYLSVTAPHADKKVAESKSWLYFDASALPAGIEEKDFESVQLQLVLVPKEGIPRGMAITVAPAKGSTADAGYAAVDVANASTLQSDRLPKDMDELELRSDVASLPRAPGLLKSKPDGSRYVGLVLLPQPNASRRVYYGLTTQNHDDPKDTYDHPDRLPRLVITYRRPPPSYSACSSEPSALAESQSDGRLADTSPCAFIPTPNNLVPTPDSPAKSLYVLQIAPGTRTRTPVVYGDRIYVVRGDESQSRLEELGPLGDVIASLPLVVVDGGGEKRFLNVAPDSLMVVDRFGRLRIITNDAVLTAQLEPGGNLPASVEEGKFAFGAVPDSVVPGPDGTLYIVKQSIFALNPKVGKLGANGKPVPEKLWDVAIETPRSARMTLGPDGRFLYVLARLEDKYSGFIAINAQTGKDVQLLAGRVNTSGTVVNWVSGLTFDKAAVTVGQTIPIGRGDETKSCTVQSKSAQSLTCKEDIGKQSGVPWADFPKYLDSFRNPVVARGLHGVDYIYITGNLGEKTTLWGVRNEPGPVPQDRDYLARLTAEWKYNPGENSSLGQPILDSTLAPADTGLSGKRLYFLQKGGGGEPKLVALKALDGTPAAQPTTAPKLPAKISTEGNPVVDSAGDVILWADNTLYGFNADTGPLFTAQPNMSPVPQLLFGPGGTLYAVSGTTVSALVPSFTLNADSPSNICSPTHLQVTGTATAGQQWQLSARGSVILGNGFVVQSGAQLKVTVDVSKCAGG